MNEFECKYFWSQVVELMPFWAVQDINDQTITLVQKQIQPSKAPQENNEPKSR